MNLPVFIIYSQLDLLYYGTLSVVDKKRNWKGNCEDPAQVNGSLDSVLNKESGRTSAPSVLVAELHESKVEISASARQTFGSPKIDTMLTMDHGLHGNGQKKFYLSKDFTEEQKRYKELWLHAESDGAALDLLGAVLQDIPQIILQLYLLALSLPTLSASVLRYSSFFNAFHVDPWLFATVLDRIKLENSSNVVSDTDTALLAADEEAILKDTNIIGNLKPMRRIAPTGSKLSSISDTSTTDSLPTNFESILTIPSLNKTSEAAALGLVAPEELLPETEKHLAVVSVWVPVCGVLVRLLVGASCETCFSSSHQPLPCLIAASHSVSSRCHSASSSLLRSTSSSICLVASASVTSAVGCSHHLDTKPAVQVVRATPPTS
ncbi:XK-related protein [Trinorchestia longiramus]|nr:XK-related protein [Trinorchestia longiramus]